MIQKPTEDECQLVLEQAAANGMYWEQRNCAIGTPDTDTRQDNGLESLAARLRREINQRDLELINQHSDRLKRETDEVIAYQVPL
jgi:hypothetical protein